MEYSRVAPEKKMEREREREGETTQNPVATCSFSGGNLNNLWEWSHSLGRGYHLVGFLNPP